MSGNIKLTVYHPETGKIGGLVEVQNPDDAAFWMDQGFVLAPGHHDAATHFINPETGKPNKHKSDATRPQVPIERRWAEVRNRRTQLLDAWRWTVMPDSPLAADNQAEWLAWLKALHAVTKGVEDPGGVVWPDQPALRYAEDADGG